MVDLLVVEDTCTPKKYNSLLNPIIFILNTLKFKILDINLLALTIK